MGYAFGWAAPHNRRRSQYSETFPKKQESATLHDDTETAQRLMNNHSDIESSYDSVAAEFVGEFFGELARKPFDCQVLDRFAEALRGKGQVCEIGSGPGQIARYLKD